MRAISVFRIMLDTFLHHQQLPTRGIDGVSVDLVELCELDGSSTPANNRYFWLADALSRLLEVPKGEASVGRIFMVVGVNTKGLCACLEEKDPVSLLLLYLWYTKARESR